MIPFARAGAPKTGANIPSRRTGLLALLVVAATTLAPMALLAYARHQDSVAADRATDVHLSGSLQFRALWLHAVTQRDSEAARAATDWRPVYAHMTTTRQWLRTRYPDAVRATDASWQNFDRALRERGRLDWATAEQMRLAADALTNHIDAKSHADARHVGKLLGGGMISLALSLPVGLYLLWRLQKSAAALRESEALLSAFHDSTPLMMGVVELKEAAG